jgi:hypothetical protein
VDDFYAVWQRLGIEALEQAAKKQPAKFIMVAASLIPQHFKLEHEHKLKGLSDAELQQRLLEAEEELAKAGVTIDLEAKEVVVLPPPKWAVCENGRVAVGNPGQAGCLATAGHCHINSFASRSAFGCGQRPKVKACTH